MRGSTKFKLVGAALLGILIGGYLMRDVRPRSAFDLPQCENCLNPNEVVGLVAAVGIQRATGLVPAVVYETPKTLVIKHPAGAAPYHVVLIPNRDIKNIGDISPEDKESLVDLYAVAAKLIKEKKLKNYRLWTNGPGNQIVAYLHFHLAGSD